MNIKKTLGALVLSASITAFTTSCGDNSKDSKEVAEEMNEAKFNNEGEKDADKLVHAYSANLYEIKAAENAGLNASSADVKKLAAMLVSAHSKMNADVKALADKKQISLPAELTDDQVKKMEGLTEKSGMDYDKEFTEQMKEKHEDAIDFYEKTAEKCDDADIKAWASQTLPEVRSHLEMVMNAHQMVHDKK